MLRHGGCCRDTGSYWLKLFRGATNHETIIKAGLLPALVPWAGIALTTG